MNRLADLILETARSQAADEDGDKPRAFSNLERLLYSDADPPALVPIVAADDVAEHFYVDVAQLPDDLDIALNRLVPPWPGVFIEMRRPTETFSVSFESLPSTDLPPSWGWRVDARGPREFALLFAEPGRLTQVKRNCELRLEALAESGHVDMAAVHRARKCDDPLAASGRLGEHERAYLRAHDEFEKLKQCDDQETVGRLAAEAGWVLTARLVIERDGEAIGPVATVRLRLNQDGRMIGEPVLDLHEIGGLRPAELARFAHDVLFLFQPVILTLSYLNAASVARRRHAPERELDERRMEEGMPAFVTYETLDLAAVTRSDRN